MGKNDLSKQKGWKTLFDLLVSNHVPPADATDLVKAFFRDQSQKLDNCPVCLKRMFRDWLEAALSGPPPLPCVPESGRACWVFAGPSGSGKSSTVLKIAARLSLMPRSSRKIGILFLGESPVAGMSRFEQVSQIIECGFETASTPSEAKDAIQRLEGADLILVETVIEVSHSASREAEAKELLHELPNRKTFLLLPAWASLENLMGMVAAYGFLNIDGLVATKVDEADFVGPLLAVLNRTKLPLAWTTFGSVIPNDCSDRSSQLLERLFARNHAPFGT